MMYRMERTRRTGQELTSRQREVLALVAKGHTNGEIAELLGISVDGVKWHVSELLTRLDVDSREDAAEVWRRAQGLPTRFRGFISGVFSSPLAILRIAATAGLVGAGATGAILALSAVHGTTSGPATVSAETTSPNRPPLPTPGLCISVPQACKLATDFAESLNGRSTSSALDFLTLRTIQCTGAPATALAFEATFCDGQPAGSTRAGFLVGTLASDAAAYRDDAATAAHLDVFRGRQAADAADALGEQSIRLASISNPASDDDCSGCIELAFSQISLSAPIGSVATYSRELLVLKVRPQNQAFTVYGIFTGEVQDELLFGGGTRHGTLGPVGNSLYYGQKINVKELLANSTCLPYSDVPGGNTLCAAPAATIALAGREGLGGQEYWLVRFLGGDGAGWIAAQDLLDK